MDIKIRPGPGRRPFEYLCGGCGQLRLTYVDVTTCGNCGSDQLTTGPLGSLQKP